MNTIGMDSQGFYSAERLWHRVPENAELKKKKPAALLALLAAEGFIELNADGQRWRPLPPYQRIRQRLESYSAIS